jgi:exosortase/archaeosortase family protein
VTERGWSVLVRLGILLGLLVLGYVWLQRPFRAAETATAAALASALGLGSLHVAAPSAVIVLPVRGEPFRAVVTPSCSSVASVLAIGCLASLAPGYAQLRKVAAAAAAMATVALGNVLRIAGSLTVGLLAGRSSLVLFHDSVGNIFSFAYTLGGYIVMLWFLLPADTAIPLEVPYARP